MKKKIAACILSASMLFGAVLMPGTFAENTEEINGKGTSIRYANRKLIPEYEHYDPTKFLAECEKLENGNWSGNESYALTMYDELLSEFNSIDANFMIISVLQDEDVTDKDMEQEYLYTSSIYTEAKDAFYAACHALATGPISSAFEKHIDTLDFEYMRDYHPMTEEEQKISDRLAELEIEYDALMTSDRYECKAAAAGKEYTLRDFDEDQIYEELSEEQLKEVYLALLKQINDKAGKIFLEMVPLRNQLAKFKGYESFVEYADKETYCRDFSTAETEQFYKTVKAFMKDKMQYLTIPELPEMESSASAIIDNTDKILGGSSKILDKSLSYLKTNGLCSIGNDEKRVEGAFTASLINIPGAAFVYEYTYGNAYDMISFTHELGHFINMHNTNPMVCYYVQNEVAEIQSTGLELITANRYDRILNSSDAKSVLAYELLSNLDSVQSGCLIDEWQRQVYTHPEMTLSEINDLYYSLSQEYGIDELGMEYKWMNIPHNFSSPMYYISYAVSALSALEIWEMSRNDYDSAVKVWENIEKVCLPYSYFETMKSNGLNPFTDAKATEMTMQNAYDVFIDLTYSDQIEGLNNDKLNEAA